MAKIALLTNFQDFNPGYSLTGIVEDQMNIMERYNHDVHLFINTSINRESINALQNRHPLVTFHDVIPFSHLIDYQSKTALVKEGEDERHNHQKLVEKTRDVLTEELKDFDFVFTHDWIFVGWFLPYGLGCIEAAKQLPNIRWFHWIHSMPSSMRDWWNIREWGPNHKLVFPNSSDAIQVAEQYRGELSDVRVIPHCKDLRSWFDFSEDTCSIIDQLPGLMRADVVQIFPAGTDRLSAKRVDYVIKIFAELKKQGKSVCLAIANQWATGRQRKECIEPFEQLAARSGLIIGREFVFTSDLGNAFKNGLEKRVLRELFMTSNLFIFPTREESFGLVVPEASLTSGCFMVLNKSLDMQREISGNNALYFDFGSFSRNHDIKNPDLYFKDLAWIIAGRMNQSESVMTKTYFRQNNNWDSLYNKYYMPSMMAEKSFTV